MGDIDCQCLFLVGFNFVLWQHLFDITAADGKGIAMRVAFGVMILAAFNIVLTLLAFRPSLSRCLTLMFMISAGVAYFMSQYGVMIDAGMFRNFAETNATEVRDLTVDEVTCLYCAAGCFAVVGFVENPDQLSSLAP